MPSDAHGESSAAHRQDKTRRQVRLYWPAFSQRRIKPSQTLLQVSIARVHSFALRGPRLHALLPNNAGAHHIGAERSRDFQCLGMVAGGFNNGSGKLPEEFGCCKPCSVDNSGRLVRVRWSGRTLGFCIAASPPNFLNRFLALLVWVCGWEKLLHAVITPPVDYILLIVTPNTTTKKEV